MNAQTLLTAFVPLPGQATAVYISSGLDHYRHSDWLGSARLTSSPSQTYLSSTAYTPFGDTYAQSGTADPSFTGQNSDTVSTDYDFLFRTFSTTGRWASPDPAGLAAVDPANPQSWNRYSYVMNVPMNLVDPSGMCAQIRDADGQFHCIDTCPECVGGGGSTCYVDGIITSCQDVMHEFFHDDPFEVLRAAYTPTGTTPNPNCPNLDCANLKEADLLVYGNLGLLSLVDVFYRSFLPPFLGGNTSGLGTVAGPTPKLTFKPPSWKNFTHEFLPCYGARLYNNFLGNDDRTWVTAGTVAALKLKNPWAAGAALLVWTGINAFDAGSKCAVASRAVHK
jgi:RHS repeat-associated protein